MEVRKNSKRILSVGLFLCMLLSLFSVAAYADGKSALLPGQYVTTEGENVEIKLEATDSAGVIALLCEVEFDAEFLEILRYDDARLIGGTLTAKTDESPMRLFWMDVLAKKNTLVEGTLGTFTFKALKAGKTKDNTSHTETVIGINDICFEKNNYFDWSTVDTDNWINRNVSLVLDADGNVDVEAKRGGAEGFTSGVLAVALYDADGRVIELIKEVTITDGKFVYEVPASKVATAKTIKAFVFDSIVTTVPLMRHGVIEFN